MQIDWFTVVAQIVNFLILAGLLAKLLYRPIVSAMQEREERIAARMHEAEEREQEAEAARRDHEQKLKELEERREEVLARAREDADDERERLIDEARRSAREAEQRWHRALQDEQDAFMRELRRRVADQLCAVSRAALADLADADLQGRMVDVFVTRARDLDEERRVALCTGLRESERPPVVTTAFELSGDRRERLIAAVRELLGSDGEIEVRRSDELLCGVELSVGGRKLGWSLDSYLDRLAESIEETLDREIERDQAEAAGEARGEEHPEHE